MNWSTEEKFRLDKDRYSEKNHVAAERCSHTDTRYVKFQSYFTVLLLREDRIFKSPPEGGNNA
jgi:hypothetical protein